MFRDNIQKTKEAAAKDSLRILRTAIETYAAQHNDLTPGYIDNTQNAPSGALAMTQLVVQTNALGYLTPGDGTPGYDLGPYLPDIPDNPFNEEYVIDIPAAFPEIPAGLTGWLYKPGDERSST